MSPDVFLAPFSKTTVAPVGGFVESVHKQAVVSPWLAVIALLGCMGIAAVVAKRRRS